MLGGKLLVPPQVLEVAQSVGTDDHKANHSDPKRVLSDIGPASIAEKNNSEPETHTRSASVPRSSTQFTRYQAVSMIVELPRYNKILIKWSVSSPPIRIRSSGRRNSYQASNSIELEVAPQIIRERGGRRYRTVAATSGINNAK